MVEGYFHAHAQASATRTYAEYVFALRAYVNGFRDGNLAFEPTLERRFFVWPGFLVGHDGRAFRVASREERLPNLPPIGSRLTGCDGASALALAEILVAPYFGNWQLESERRRFAPYLLVDRGNPYVNRPRRCEFEVDGELVMYALAWSGIRADALAPRIESARIEPARRAGVGHGPMGTGRTGGIRRFDDDAIWIVPAALDPALADVEAELRSIRQASILVIDLRRGALAPARSDAWVRRIWGDRYVEARRPRAIAVDWRASMANAEHLASQSLAAEEPERDEIAKIALGMRADAASGGIFHRVLPPPRRGRRPGKNPVRAQVFVITDSTCSGVCLETADLLLAFDGVRHVGRPTGADSLYTGVRRELLPSGLASLDFGINVVRGHPRGHNQPLVPTDPLPQGTLAPGFDLEAWIRSLSVVDAEEAAIEAPGARPRP